MEEIICIEASGLGWSVELLCSLDIMNGSGDSRLSWIDSPTGGTATATVNGLQKRVESGSQT